MWNPTIIFHFIWLITYFIVSITSIIFLIKNRMNYAISLIPVFNIIMIFFVGIIYPILLFLSMSIYFSETLNISLFLAVIINESIIIWLYSFDMSMLKEYGKIPLFIFLYFSLVFSILMGILISISNVTISAQEIGLLYTLNNLSKIIVTIFNCSVLIYLIYASLKIKMISRFKQLSQNILIFISVLSLASSFFCFSLFFENIVLIHLFILLFSFSLILKCFITIKYPKIYVKLTNKIYFIHIYHKSGVLLYSYDFKNNNQPTESTILGNILIGLNHILSEFINKEDQIDVFQTENTEIVVDYNNNSGFAVLLITNQRNIFMEYCMAQFMKDFEKRYKSELKEIEDINKMINVSEFKDTKEIIEKNFQIFFK